MDEKKMRMELLNTYSFRELAEMYLRALDELERLKKESNRRVELFGDVINFKENRKKDFRNTRKDD